MASNFSPMYFEQPIVIFDTTQSLNSTSGSFVLYGGMSINATADSSYGFTDGSFVLSGGMGIQKNLNVGGITTIHTTTESEGTQSGALVVKGGVGIAKNLHIGEDTFIGGNLYVNGTTTSINSTTINVVDNTFTLNSGPSGSRDAGFLIQRFQQWSDSGAGDVVGANEPIVLSGTLASGGTGSVTFATTDAALNPTGWWIKVTSGSGPVYARKISTSSNDGSIVTVNFLDTDTYTDPQGVSQPTHNDKPFTSAVSSPNPFALYNRNYVAQYYDESSDEYILGYVSDASDIQTALQNTDLLNIRSKGLFAQNSTISNLTVTSLSAGNIGLDQATILSTFVVTGTTTLANLMVSGGSQIGGNITVSGASTFNGGATAGSLFVTGGSLLQGSLNVSGATLLDSDLTVTGASVFNGGATTGALFVTGGSLLQGSLNVSGATLLDNNLTVTGASVFNGGATTGALFVTGGSLLQGSLGVSGATLLGSDAYVVGPTFQIPYGNVNERPANPQQGYIRYNTEYIQFEGYGPGNAWGSLGGVIDIAQSTKILASASPSVTDGNLYFYTVGNERMRINSAGNIGINTTAPTNTLDVVGTLGVTLGITTGSLNVTGASIMQDNLTVTTGSVIISTNDYTPIIGATSATGGSIIFNSVDVSPSMGDISRERVFNASNPVPNATSITGFAFSNDIVRAFDAVVSVTILTDNNTNKYAYYNLKGVQKAGNWVINSSYVGDVTGYTFSITDSGQVQYTSTSIAGWTSATVHFRALTTTK